MFRRHSAACCPPLCVLLALHFTSLSLLNLMHHSVPIVMTFVDTFAFYYCARMHRCTVKLATLRFVHMKMLLHPYLSMFPEYCGPHGRMRGDFSITCIIVLRAIYALNVFVGNGKSGRQVECMCFHYVILVTFFSRVVFCVILAKHRYACRVRLRLQ